VDSNRSLHGGRGVGVGVLLVCLLYLGVVVGSL